MLLLYDKLCLMNIIFYPFSSDYDGIEDEVNKYHVELMSTLIDD